MGADLVEVLQLKRAKQEFGELMSCNEKTGRYGLSLSEQETRELMHCRDKSLKKYRRVEFGKGMLEPLIYAFCDSQYIQPDNYLNTLMRLQDIFYEFKNESQDKLNDEELMTFMREQFETVCYGDLDYLEGTCLPRFATAIRYGYRGFERSGGHNEYEAFSEEERWDAELYQDVLKELFW